MTKDLIDYILVYKANAKGFPGFEHQHHDADLLRRLPSCVKFKWNDAANKFRYANGTWASTSVNACAGEADNVGVYLHVTHKFVTGSSAPRSDWTTALSVTFEPLPPDNCKSTSPFPHP